jgi:lipoprotein NlpD
MSEIPVFRCPKAFAVGILAVLAGCASAPNHAPVTDLSSGRTTRPPVAVAAPPPSGPGYYTVKKGDTLYGIALQAGQDYRQIAAWNNLDSSYVIHVDQVLRIAPPDTGNAQAQPIAGSAVVERPLGTPAGSLPPGYAPAAPQAVSGDVPNIAGPLATKRPYSDAALAEMSKPDSDQTGAAPQPSTNAAVVVQSPGQAPDDDENVGWAWPVSGPVIAGFNDSTNKGLNISGKAGTPILAAANGTVLYVGNGVRGYGNLVVVKHNATYISVYAHNSKILVTEQQAVTKGQKIAEMGDSDADQVELHFEIRRQGKPVDPMKYLQPR